MIEITLVVVVVVLLGLSAANTRVLREYQRGVLFRLGRLRPLAGPGSSAQSSGDIDNPEHKGERRVASQGTLKAPTDQSQEPENKWVRL